MVTRRRVADDRPVPPFTPTGASRRSVATVLLALAAAGALGWFAGGPSSGEDPLDQLLGRLLPAAALAGLVTGVAVGAAETWRDRTDGGGWRAVTLWSAPLASIPFTIAWACRDAARYDLTADEVVGISFTAAVIGFVPSLVGLGLGTLAGLLVGPTRRG